MDERQKDLSNYRITQADDSLKVADYCLKATNESIYITQNDEGDMVIKSIDTFERETRRAVELTVWIDTCEVTGNVPRGVFCGQSKQ